MDNKSARSALVLSGGGAYGAYEVGVIKALYEGKTPTSGGVALNPDVYVGTSVGGFNAAVLAANEGGPRESIARLESIWRDQVADKSDGRGNGVYRIRGNPANYLDPRIPGVPLESLDRLIADIRALGMAAVPRMLHLLEADSGLIDRVEGLVDISAFVDSDPFCDLVEKNLDGKKLKESGKKLRVIATSWKTGDMQEFDFPRMTHKETCAAIRASAAIPGLFPRVHLWDQELLDGGVVQNTPVRPAIEEGAEEIHVVSLNAKLSQFPQSALENTLDTFTRVYASMMSSNLDEDIATARWVNDGIEVMQRMETGEAMNGDTMARFARVARVIYERLVQTGKLPRLLTIHRYFPNICLGDTLGMLNFHESAINELIEQGYKDAIAHDCEANECVVPKLSFAGKPA